MPTLPDESMSIDCPAALLNTKTLDPGVTPVAVGGIAWMLPTTVKFAKRLLHIRSVRDYEFYSSIIRTTESSGWLLMGAFHSL
jgi:hypothetical protein